MESLSFLIFNITQAQVFLKISQEIASEGENKLLDNVHEIILFSLEEDFFEFFINSI